MGFGSKQPGSRCDVVQLDQGVRRGPKGTDELGRAWMRVAEPCSHLLTSRGSICWAEMMTVDLLEGRNGND